MAITTVEQALQTVWKLYRALDLRRPDIESQDSYYRGEQPLTFASDQWSKAHAKLYKDFSDNWCGVVGNSPVERLGLAGIRIGDDADVFSSDEKQLWTDWLANDGDAQFSQVALQSVISKRGAFMVWGTGDDEPVLTCEHPAQTVVGYDPETRRRIAGLKTWIDADASTEYATLSTPEFVWKFQRPSYLSRIDRDGRTLTGLYVEAWTRGEGGWIQREVPGEPWPLVNPFGEVNIVEVPNRPMLGGEPVSDIAGTMAMQDAINLMWAYLFNAADFASMPARVVLGMEPPKVPILDADGQIIGTQPAKMSDIGERRIMFLHGPDAAGAKIGQWEAANLSVFTGVIEDAVGHVAAQTRTPPHYLVTNKGLSNLSGDALTAAETGLVKKCEEWQRFSSGAIRDVFRLMAKARGNDRLAASLTSSSIRWRDAETRSQAQAADAATKDAAIGLPLAYILENRYGLTQMEIDRVLAMKAAEKDLWQPPAVERITDATASQPPADQAPAVAPTTGAAAPVGA